MSSTTPKLSLTHTWALGENGWNTGMDNNMKALDAIVQLAVESQTLVTPPSGVEGNVYIIPAAATGIWAGRTNQLAQYISGVWIYYTPKEGYNCWVKDTDIRVDYNGTIWAVSKISLSMIPVGTEGQKLTMVAGVPTWV